MTGITAKVLTFGSILQTLTTCRPVQPPADDTMTKHYRANGPLRDQGHPVCLLTLKIVGCCYLSAAGTRLRERERGLERERGWEGGNRERGRERERGGGREQREGGRERGGEGGSRERAGEREGGREGAERGREREGGGREQRERERGRERERKGGSEGTERGRRRGRENVLAGVTAEGLTHGSRIPTLTTGLYSLLWMIP